jgi:hypothetical protein
VLAFTGPRLIGELETAAAREQPRGDRIIFRHVALPRQDFVEHVGEKVCGILVSHRVDRRLGGPLHAETNYSPPIAPSVLPPASTLVRAKRRPKPPESCHHVRKALHKLTETEINGDAIVDAVVRELVQKKYADLGRGRPAKVFADPSHHPKLPNRYGDPVPIHSVRVKTDAKPFAVDKKNTRFVIAGPGSNHHIEVVAELDPAGRDSRWVEQPIVTRREAHRRKADRRKASGQDIVQKRWGPQRRFVFSLFAGDYLEWRNKDGVRRIHRIISISPGNIECRLPEDGRLSTAIRKLKKERIFITNVDSLRVKETRKLSVTPLGKVFCCND